METAAAQNVYHVVMESSIMTAYLAQKLADALRVPHHQQAYLAGLLQQVGRLVLLQQKQQAYTAVWYALPDDAQAEDAHELVCPSRADEQQAIGVDYVAIGRKVAAHWHLPKVVQACIRYQFTPDEVVHVPYRPIVHVTRVANLWAYHTLIDEPSTPEPSSNEALALADAPPAFSDALEALAHLRKKSPEGLFDLVESHHADALDAVSARIP
jgi:HD-like signal output (HDOD) protein